MKVPIEMVKAIQSLGQQYLTDAEFNGMFEDGLKWADDQVADGLTMAIIAHGKEVGTNKKVTVPILFADWPPEDKQTTLMGLGMKFRADFPDCMLMCLVHVTEGWVSQYSKDDDTPAEDRPRPSQDPKKVEAVIVHATSMDSRQSQSIREIVRNPEGDFIELKPMIEDRHDPKNPKTSQGDHLIRYMWQGYMAAVQAGRGEE